MNTATIVAIVALVSTFVGATIGAATNYLLAVKREKTGRRIEVRHHAIELKRAARLIDAELMRARSAARICIEERHWWSADVRELSTEAWQKYGDTVAPDLSDEAWFAILAAVEAVENIRSARGIFIDQRLGAHPISDAIAARLVPMLSDVELGRVALAPLVYGSPLVSISK